MYRLNSVNPNTTTTTVHQVQNVQSDNRALTAVIKNQLDIINPSNGGIGNIQRAANELMVTTVKVEPMQDMASTSTPNGHVIYAGKRPRIEGNEDWLSSPSPGSVPGNALPLSPSPGSQSHTYATTMSNGYSSPMSTGSYDPYSPNGKLGEYKILNLFYYHN
uniref:CSON009621 protein n=1 Tax=Culicoides sonorensis TaxID=179676 RepID=A0A336MYE7_CULSO